VKSYRQYLLIVVFALSLVACGNGNEDSRARKNDRHARPVELLLTEDGRPAAHVLAEEQILHRDNGEEPQTLDPHLAQGLPSLHILRDLFEGLTSEAPDGRIIPGAAIRWNISRDGKTYTFYLRRDAFWSNGDPVTAADFVYGLRRSANPATASITAQALLPIANAAEVLAGKLPLEELGVTAMDDFTLQITMIDPTPYFLGLLNNPSTYPVHRASILEHGSAFSRAGNLISNGAYILKDWTIRSHVELVKNENYWDAENTIIEKVFFYPFEDQSTAAKRFRSGKLHWTFGVPNNQFKWLQEHYPDELVVSPWLGSYYFGFNLVREPFTRNPDLRKALMLALDRKLLTEKVTQFGEQPSFSLVPPGIMDYVSPVPEWSEWTQEQRTAEARRLYAAAGYNEENPLSFDIRYDPGENNKKMALAVSSLWKQVLGVKSTLINEEPKVFLQNREQKVLTQVFRAGWIGEYADAYSFLNLFRTDHQRNDFGYSDETYDSLLDEVAAERIPSRRRRLMYETERMLLADIPFIPLYTNVTKRLVDPRLRGWQNNVMDHHYSKHMFLLKLASDATTEPVAAEVVQPINEQTEALDPETQAPILEEGEAIIESDMEQSGTIIIEAEEVADPVNQEAEPVVDQTDTDTDAEPADVIDDATTDDNEEAEDPVE